MIGAGSRGGSVEDEPTEDGFNTVGSPEATTNLDIKGSYANLPDFVVSSSASSSDGVHVGQPYLRFTQLFEAKTPILD